MKRKIIHRAFCLILGASLLSGCGTDTSSNNDTETTLSLVDNSAWNYEEDADVYWQVGISYCESPANSSYETLGIYVPGAYMDAEDNGDGTYTCTLNTESEIEGYTAESAPIVIPVNTPGYSAQDAPTEYSESVSEYTSAGFIYVWAGCRGRDDGAPAGVTDLKAAIRYIRYNEGNIAGDMDSIFSFGMSGGGAQSALLGSTGDSDMYTAYLEEIGAVMDTSDAVAGSMCWCPITSLDIADEAYEWNMGVTRTNLSDDEQELSDDLAEEFANYINELEITDEDGNVLTLEKSSEGIYQAGSYYEYVKSVIEDSLEDYIKNESYKTSSNTNSMGGMPSGQAPTDDMPLGDLPTDDVEGSIPSGEKPDGLPDDEQAQYAKDGVERDTSNLNTSTSETYDTAEEYIESLNEDNEWVTYDSSTGEVTITSIADFVKACKNSSKSLGAFDQLDAGQAENTLFGYGDGQGAHFDSILASLLSENDYGTDYTSNYEEDLKKTDSLGNTVEYRSNMYNPLYFLSDYYDGYNTSTVAKYWRIRTGINQSDTSLTTEINLALALRAYGVDVDFATIWSQGHTEAESTGDSTSNFINWINECLEN